MQDDALHDQGILIVDDEEVIGWAIGEFLRKEGFRNVWHVTNGRECVEFVRANGADVAMIVLDVSMPKLDGPAAVEILAREHGEATGVIFMTGWPTQGLKERWPTLGSDGIRVLDFLEKPFEMGDLAERIRAGLPAIIEQRRVGEA